MHESEFRTQTPEQTPKDEMEVIREAQKREREWFSDIAAMETDTDLSRAVERGDAVHIQTEGDGYKIAAKVPEQRRVLRPEAKEVMDTVTERWKERVREEFGDEDEHYFLVISSLARTTTFQNELIEQGYPALPDSTHTKLAAFDIGTTWLKENKPRLLELLDETLQTHTDPEHINWIDEPTIGAYHICTRPTDPDIARETY